MNLTWRASRSARPYSESRSAGTYLRSRGPRPRESVTPSLSFSSDLSPEQIAVHSMETAERMAERALLLDGDSSPTWLTNVFQLQKPRSDKPTAYPEPLPYQTARPQDDDLDSGLAGAEGRRMLGVLLRRGPSLFRRRAARFHQIFL